MKIREFVPSHLTRWWLKGLLMFHPFFQHRWTQTFCCCFRIFNFSFKEAFHVIQRSSRVGGHSWKKHTRVLLWLSDIKEAEKRTEAMRSAFSNGCETHYKKRRKIVDVVHKNWYLSMTGQKTKKKERKVVKSSRFDLLRLHVWI